LGAGAADGERRGLPLYASNANVEKLAVLLQVWATGMPVAGDEQAELFRPRASPKILLLVNPKGNPAVDRFAQLDFELSMAPLDRAASLMKTLPLQHASYILAAPHRENRARRAPILAFLANV
jgi:hypothetical protein